jgi:M6 family metalloprotease-like protein
MAQPPLSLAEFQSTVASLARTPNLLAARISELLPLVVGPSIDYFSPIEGYGGTMLEIHGRNFSPTKTDNLVTVGGSPAYVLDAAPDKLTVITALSTLTGPVNVQVASHSDDGPVDFTVLPAPIASKGEDGPPIFYKGRGVPARRAGAGPAAGVSAQGTIKALIVLCTPQDRMPGNATTERNDLISRFDNAPTFYDQVSFGDTDLQMTYTDWVQLSGNYADYVDDSINNFIWPADRILAEAAQGAVDQGNDLDDFIFMAVVMFMGTGGARAWGGWSQSNFAWNGSDLNGNPISINQTASHDLGLTTIGQNADWGRFAHELAHSLVDAGAVLGEDIYSSDLIDPTVATAARYDLMGNHDSHPCFSGHFMRQLGYYDSSNIAELTWDRNPFAQTFTLVAHGSAQNTNSGRRHLVRISVGGGVFYYVEVRQLVDPAVGLFDTSIPVSGPNNGGVVVTKVVTDQVNVNQELRFVSLLHDVGTQDTGAVIEDPARALVITVGNVVQTNPLVMNVDVEWAQTIADDVNGTFDLRLTQTSVPWVSDDVWVDRQPWGITNETDGDGNIVATREKPRPGEINHLFGQVFNAGPDDATNVKLTYYAITPPGVGDNGAWAPIGTRTLPSVPASSARSDSINWTPIVGEHTCLKVYASPQFGEITGGNNQCQENVFYFAPPASSPPDPVRMKVAVRNPLDYDSPILLTTANVPDGYVVHVPHKWVHLPAKGERRIELTIIPLVDINQYKERKIPFRTAPIQLRGHVPHPYSEALPITDVPAATHRTIGGITASVTPKRRGDIKAEPDSSCKTGLGVRGNVSPGLTGQAVTVTVKTVGGTRFSVETKTGPGGRFAVCIDPRAAATTEQEPWDAKQNGAIAKFDGLYELVCETFDAADIAYAKSKPIYIDLRGVRPRAKDRATPAAERPKVRAKVVRLPDGDLSGVPAVGVGKTEPAYAKTDD